MPVHDWTRVVAGIYHDFHQAWIIEIRNALNDGLLPDDFYAMAEGVVAGSIPDVLALERDDPRGSGPGGAIVAVAAHPPKVSFTVNAEREVYAKKADRVAVFHAGGDRLVAGVEIVSPGNKSGRQPLKTFIRKLTRALRRRCHLLVVDPLPPGRSAPRGVHAAFWEDQFGDTEGVTVERPFGLSAYRAVAVPTAYFEPVGLDRPLPDMPLFLTPDHYVNVPLEATYLAAWRGVPRRWKEVLEAGPAA